MRVQGYSQRERKDYRLEGFQGYDFSESPISASPRRAIEGRNFVIEDGVLQKRKGWRELLRILDQNDLPRRINGIWHFQTMQYVDEDMDLREPAEFTIVHAGTKFFSVNFLTGSAMAIYDQVEDTRSYGIYNDGKFYVFCGNYLVFGQFKDSNFSKNNGWEMREVFNNAETFVPKTTINIGYFGQKDDITKLYDKPNILRTRRKNGFSTTSQLLDKDGKPTSDPAQAVNAEEIKKYQTDTKVIDPGLVVVTVFRLDSEGKMHEEEYRNSKTGTKWSETLSGGGVTFGTAHFDTGIISLVSAIPPLGNEQDNMIVEFEYLPRDGEIITDYEKRITKCRFGTRFGCAGVDDRVFVSGNESYPNLCYHSGINDMTYFSDEDVAVCGSDSSAITAFSRLGDGTLAIHKEANGQEISIYYRTGEIRTETELDGTVKRTEIFPVKAGAIGEGAVSPWSCANLSGDNLMLSQNGVYGLVLANNVATNERYARERSRTVNRKLLSYELADSASVIYQNKYYLSAWKTNHLGERVYGCFIADARYVYRKNGDLSEAFNYEWWYLENVPARVWAVIDNELYFGTDGGQICLFDEMFSDRSRQETKSGECTIDFGTNRIFINKKLFYAVDESDLVKMKSLLLNLSALFADPSEMTIKDGRIFLKKEKYVVEGMSLYVDKSLDIPATSYTVRDVDYSENSFLLYNADQVCLITRPLRLSFRIEGMELLIVNPESTETESSFQVLRSGDSEPLMLVKYLEVPPQNILLEFSFQKPVVAEWLTPMLDFGSFALSKHLHTISVVTEPGVDGKMTFGYVTRNSDRTDLSYATTSFSFNNIDFRNFTFVINNFAVAYTKRIFERSCNFVMLRVGSSEATNCAVHSLGIEYSIIKKSKGVK